MLPPEAIEALKRALKGKTLVPAGETFQIERSLPHAHVAAVLGTLRSLGLESLLSAKPCRERDLDSRDGKQDQLQIVFGLLCTAGGCPVAVEAFPGNTSDPHTLGSPVRKIRERFGLKRVALVATQGLLMEMRIESELRPLEGDLDWITALRAPAIRALVEQGELQFSLFDERDLAEITSKAYPDERLIACRNPLLAAERALRSIKTVDLEVRPIHHRTELRVRAHVFLCMLAYYVEWHMRVRLRPLLFEDHEKGAAEQERASIIEPAKRSAAARRKVQTRRTEEDLPVHSFQTLLKDLATLTKNVVRVTGAAFEQPSRPTPLQQRAFELLGVTPK